MRIGRPTAWAIAILAATSAAGAVVVAQSVRLQGAERRRTAAHAARRAASALEAELARSLSAAYALGAAVRDHGGVEEFDHLAEAMIPIYGGIASLQLAPGGVVRQVHPLAGNEAALGHDLLADPARRDEAVAAIRSRQLTLAGPFPLRQGGIGLIGRYPVFRAGVDGRDAFWGFTNVALRLDDVLAASRLPELEREGFAYYLVRTDARSGRTLRIASGGTLVEDPERVAVSVPNGEWTLAIAPTDGWHDPAREAVGYLLALLVGLCSAAVAWVFAAQPERLRTLVAERTAELEHAYEQLEQDHLARRRTEEQLRHAQKMEAIGQLAGGVAHDFNNLLTGMLACSVAIAEEAPKGSATEESARTIEQAARRAAELTRQLLGFARRGKLRSAPVDVHEAVRNVARLLGRTIDARISVETRLDATRPVVLGDAGQLEQAVLNLAVNARDAMPGGGTITFATSVVERTAADLVPYPPARPGAYVALAVTDTGTGIEPEILEHIFEPFFTTKEQGRGTGMGLATVYGIATNHGGFVEVISEKGSGTRFAVFLPAHDGAAASEPAHVPPPALPRRCRVLVVDDEAVVRASSERVLARLGCDSVACAGGEAAVELLRASATAFDLAVVDLGMPGMDGVDTVRALRAVAPAMPVVMASGYGRDGRAQEALDAGAVEFLQKPWTVEELSGALARALARAPCA